MDEINKKFDGVFWEWKGRKVIKDLKPICPDCKYELDIKMTELETKQGELTEDGIRSIIINTPQVSYSCPKCSFSVNTTINDLDSPKSLRKAALKEFEYRQRIKMSENTGDS